MIASQALPIFDSNIIQDITLWAKELGFQGLGITDIDLSQYQPRFLSWLEKKFHGEMDYMQKHGPKRYKPEALVPGTIRVISVRIDYLPDQKMKLLLEKSKKAYIARYALGQDYHRLIRKRLQKLAEKIDQKIHHHGYRSFADSAPVLEKPLAEKAGLGWIGKHTNLINHKEGSWFFIGEIFTDLPLPINKPATNHCGSCTQCIEVCPTKAIIGPYQLDARRCISYLTIEYKGSIPIEFRSMMGNRIYGCDDCQIFCPWNKFAKISNEKAFQPKHNLDSIDLIELFNWSEKEFYQKTLGSAIRRIGYECWLRNIAIALGNADYDEVIIQALKTRLPSVTDLVKEHIQWALDQQIKGSPH